MTFDRPLALLSLAVLAALLGAYVRLSRRRPRYVVRYSNVDVLRSVAPTGPSRLRRHAGAALLTVAFVPLCVAVAGPHVNRSAPVENATVVLVLDTSRSMLSTDVAPTRLDAAKAAAQRFLERAPARLRVGLVTFAGDVSVAAIPTHDRQRVRRSVPRSTSSRPAVRPRSATRSPAPSSSRATPSRSPGRLPLRRGRSRPAAR